MSVLFSCEHGWLISHKDLIDQLYEKVREDKEIKKYGIKNSLFAINFPFVTSEKKNVKNKACYLKNNNFEDLKKEVSLVEEKYAKLYEQIRCCNLWRSASSSSGKNADALGAAEVVYDESGKHLVSDAYGVNDCDAVVTDLGKGKFLFPENCRFYCKNVDQIERHLVDEKYDLIVVDPPWWNKYIRRKRAKTEHGYKMIYSAELKTIPVSKLLREDGLMVVWCTNSPQHLKTLVEDVFPGWEVEFSCKWYWLKVTVDGKPICHFSEPPGKQPFEQIILATSSKKTCQHLLSDRIIVSVPSALHSCKPPLTELLKPFLPENPKCLEVFARYLLAGWTSYGLEALRFQHESLYEQIDNS